jgi:hypothetical protein
MALQQSCMLLVLLANLPLILTLDAGATAAEKQFAADIFSELPNRSTTIPDPTC